MSYNYFLEFETEILYNKKIKFYSAELITDREKELIDEFFEEDEIVIDLSHFLGYLSKNGKFEIIISEKDLKIKPLTKVFKKQFLKYFESKSIGSFSLMDIIKEDRRGYMTINKGDRVIFKEPTGQYSISTVKVVFARLGNLIYLEGDEQAYEKSQFKKIGE